jgi:23S rRNA pseudouridine2605 synthase
MPSERLQKIIAAAGIASRRRAEEMISSGVVEVNGQIVTELGSKADPERDHIRVNGKLLRGAERHIYLLMNKPKGYVTTVSDPEGRPTVMNLLRGIRTRVYPVGRLDYASEGLLLLTNDGGLAHALTKASSHVQKVYLVKVAGVPDEAGLENLRRGLMISQGRVQAPWGGARARDDDDDDEKDRFFAAKGARNHGGAKKGIVRTGERLRGSKTQERVRTAPARIRLVRESDNPWYEVTLIEGKNRQLRKMFEEIGHHVEKIRRLRYGPLALDIPPGEFRRLTPGEVGKLKHAAGIATDFADRGR